MVLIIHQCSQVFMKPTYFQRFFMFRVVPCSQISLDVHRCLIVSIRWILEIAKTGVLCPYQLAPFLDILSPQILTFKVLWAMYSYAFQLSFFSRFISSVAVDSSLISFSSSCLSPAVRASPVFVSAAGKCSPVSSRTISFR